MSPRDNFGVVVRTVGLLILLYGLYDLTSSIYVALTPTRPHYATPIVYVVYGSAFVLVGLYFLGGASHLMRFCYPDTPLLEQEQKQNR